MKGDRSKICFRVRPEANVQSLTNGFLSMLDLVASCKIEDGVGEIQISPGSDPEEVRSFLREVICLTDID